MAYFSIEASSGQEWQFSFLLLELILADQLADHLSIEASIGRGNLLLAQLADPCRSMPPLRSLVQEW